MSLLAVQQVVSRVLTDPGFRDAFFHEPAAASAGYQLTDRELASLAELDEARVRASAEMLLLDRVRFAVFGFRASERILRPLMPDLAPRFARDFPPRPTGESRLERESERFASFVLGLVAAGELGPAYLRDVVLYERAVDRLGNSEAAWASARDVGDLARRQPDTLSADEIMAAVAGVGEHVIVEAFDYDVVDLVDRLVGGELPDSPTPRPTILVLTRTIDASTVRRQRVNARTRELLALCDGARTGHAIVEELARRGGVFDPDGREGLMRRTVVALSRLRDAGVVVLAAPLV